LQQGDSKETLMPTWLVCLLYLIAFLCFLAAAWGVTSRINLIGAGLAAWVLVPLGNAIDALV
jgi:hypothetical protein